MRIALNKDYGGFDLSADAMKELGVSHNVVLFNRDFRIDRALIDLIDRWGAFNVGGRNSTIEVVEIPDGMYWIITDYDGIENVIYSASPIESA